MAQKTKPASIGTQIRMAMTRAYPFAASQARTRLPVKSQMAPGTSKNMPVKTAPN